MKMQNVVRVRLLLGWANDLLRSRQNSKNSKAQQPREEPSGTVQTRMASGVEVQRESQSQGVAGTAGLLEVQKALSSDPGASETEQHKPVSQLGNSMFKVITEYIGV